MRGSEMASRSFLGATVDRSRCTARLGRLLTGRGAGAGSPAASSARGTSLASLVLRLGRSAAFSPVALFEHDPFQFEHWAVEYVGGFPTKKTGDKGIDGRVYFETRKELGLMVLSVKGGNVRPTDIRDLIGVLSVEEGAELAGFISNKEPSKAMKAAAAQAGQWEYEDVAYDRVQLLTVKEIVEDKKRFHTPTKIGTKSATADQIPLSV